IFVGIPNGLHRPFRPRPSLKAAVYLASFNPERAPQAIPTVKFRPYGNSLLTFQSRTGSTGHSDQNPEGIKMKIFNSFNPERAPQAIPTVFEVISLIFFIGFNPERAPQAIPTRFKRARARGPFNVS